MAPLLPGFLAAYPGVSASLDLTDRLTDLVRERYDCAVRVGDVVDANLVAIHLAENRRVVVASPTYLATHGTPRAPADLLQHNCLTLGAGSSQHRGWLFRQAGENVVQRVNGNLSCSDGAALLDWALAGLGLAWRSLWEVRQALADGELVTVLDDVAAPPNAIHALLPQRKHLPLRVRVFVDYLRQHYTDPRYWAQAQAAD